MIVCLCVRWVRPFILVVAGASDFFFFLIAVFTNGWSFPRCPFCSFNSRLHFRLFSQRHRGRAIGQYESPAAGGNDPDGPSNDPPEPERIRDGGLEGDAVHPLVTFAYQPADGPITVAVMSAQGDDGYFELVATAVVADEPTTPPPTTTTAPLVAYDQTCE